MLGKLELEKARLETPYETPLVQVSVTSQVTPLITCMMDIGQCVTLLNINQSLTDVLLLHVVRTVVRLCDHLLHPVP